MWCIESFEESYESIYRFLNKNMCMGHGVKSDYERLQAECKRIGQPPPIPRSMIDTSLFTSSNTKLAKTALILGFGTQRVCEHWDRVNDVDVIIKLTEMMPLLDVPMKTLNGRLHPMIYYLMQYNDKMDDKVKALYFCQETSNPIDPPDEELDPSMRLCMEDDNAKKKKKQQNKDLAPDTMVHAASRSNPIDPLDEEVDPSMRLCMEGDNAKKKRKKKHKKKHQNKDLAPDSMQD